MRRNVHAFSIIAWSWRLFSSSSNSNLGGISQCFSPSPLPLSLPFCCISSNFSVFSPHFYSPRTIHSHNQSHYKSGFADNVKTLDAALDLYEQMVLTSPLPSVIEFDKLLGRVIKLEHYSAAILMYKHMCFLGFIPVDHYIMTRAIICYSFLNRIDCSFSVLGSFIKRGYAPNVVTFTTLVRGLFRARMIHEALELLEWIICVKLCEPNGVLYGTIIDGLCKEGNTSAAIQVLRIMEKGKCKPDTIMYSTIIDSLCKHKMVNKALTLFSEMIDKGILPNIITYNCLIHGLCRNGKWMKAKKVWVGMVDFNTYPDVRTFNMLVDALCKDGRIDDAEYVIDTMIQRGESPNIVTYSSLMDGYCMLGRIADARRVFDLMNARGMHPDTHSYSILIKGYFKIMKVDEAMQLFREIKSKGLKPNIVTYTTILQGLFRMGELATAKHVINKMKATALIPDFHAYCVILDGLSKNGHINEALQLLEKIGSDRIGLDITMGLCEAGKLREAKGLLVKMKEDSCYPDDLAYNTIVRGFVKRDDYVEQKCILKK
nr:pentatricopeptide repeat-containing protein At1g62670, mitochondrial-like isoform X2 [Coffea arabica]